MKLLRAYRLGVAHGFAKAAARLNGSEQFCELSFQTIGAAVVDDARRQRQEEALMPGSPELEAMQARVRQYERERGPLLGYLASLSEELREQMSSEIPRGT